VIAVMALVAVLPGAAQETDVVLSNPEASDFHYVLDPPELAAFDPSSSVFPSVVYDYFAAPPNGAAPFEGLPAGSTRRLQGLAEGSHLLVGFFAEPGRREFPVRVIRLQAGGGMAERHYPIYGRPAFVNVRAGRGRLSEYPAIAPRLTEPPPSSGKAPTLSSGESASPVFGRESSTLSSGESSTPSAGESPTLSSGESSTLSAREAPTPSAGESPTLSSGFFRFRIDNRYEDWDAIPVLAAFPTGYRPGSFTLERFGRELEVLPIGESRHWRDGGTALSEVKIVRDERALYLYLSTHQAIADNLSVFLYLHGPGGRARENRLTLELVPETARAPGLVVLWEKGEDPFVVGRLASGGFFLEAEVRNDVLLPYLEQVPDLSYFDLTTCYFDRSALTYEEFYFGSPRFAEIPAPGSLF